MDSRVLSEYASLVGYSVKEWPFTYLGVPLGRDPQSIRFLDQVMEKISKRLDGWKQTYFYLWGRLTLIM